MVFKIIRCLLLLAFLLHRFLLSHFLLSRFLLSFLFCHLDVSLHLKKNC